MAKLTKKMICDFVANGGRSCLYCSSAGTVVEGKQEESLSHEWTRKIMLCTGCGMSWSNSYKLCGVMLPNPQAEDS